ncbi:hypothetical protein HYH03_000966 [Edaphochlamys debaryana]|uniref:Protein kinase domain-containing protein n=1 Tax=Edaphochlamys debaryana TaxID=47281 RepID=A0A835YEM2_9CHLO|nr:hypothetical protein HYH03_000966 [Edaphochlamys debaryana]|eukprot:KAG2501151.1 hypothetical protein HYH03_000966 [Edaphochlamys debaryana]
MEALTDFELIGQLRRSLEKEPLWMPRAVAALAKADPCDRAFLFGKATAADKGLVLDALIQKDAAAGQGQVAVPDPVSFYERFRKLLVMGGIVRPKTAVLEAIARRCPARMVAVPNSQAAHELYKEAELFPGPSTEGHLLTQHGLTVNGPLFPNPGEGSASLLVGAQGDGRPVVIKLLPQGGNASCAEAEACRVLLEPVPAHVQLVPSRLLTITLGPKHTSTAGRAPGLYSALCMPRYVLSLATMVPLPAAVVLAQGQRMVAALEHVHSKHYTHMDVKADNIFVDADGRWWLGDLGSAVPAGAPVTSTTTRFAPGNVIGLAAKPEYDWHMLAVALVCEVNRPHWKELLIEGGCTPAAKLIAAVEGLHRRDDCKDLAVFLDELLSRAGYMALPL